MRDPIPTSWGRGAPNREGGGGYARGCWGPPSPELWGMQHGDISLPPFLPPPYFALWRNFLIFGERGCWAVPSGSAISSSTTWLLEEPYIQQAVGTGRFVALLRCFSASPPPPSPAWFGFLLLDPPARSSQKLGATRGLRSWGICGLMCSGGEQFAHTLQPLGRGFAK